MRRHEPGLLVIAAVRAGREAAADMVQETLAAAVTNLRRGQWRGEGTLAAYLATILRNLIHRARTRPRIEGDPSGLDCLQAESEDPIASIEQSEARVLVRRALARLSPIHREVIVRHYFEGQSAEAIARETGTPRGTILSRLHYARLELARLVNPELAHRHKDAGGPIA